MMEQVIEVLTHSEIIFCLTQVALDVAKNIFTRKKYVDFAREIIKDKIFLQKSVKVSFIKNRRFHLPGFWSLSCES
jgi:hypothetical protein